MSAEAVFLAALTAAIESAIGVEINGVFAGPVPKVTPPYAVLGDLLSTDWSTKDRQGRELRSLVTLRDLGETPTRLHDLAARGETAIRALAPDLPGWRIASLVFVRLRIASAGVRLWTAQIEHRARLLAN